jgi:Reverse transcriptase (RNA-dependent DNA polymerase)
LKITDENLVSEEFNKFFSSVGQHISDSVKPTVKTAESFLTGDVTNENPDFRNLNLTITGPSHVCDIIKALNGKNSLDIDEISTKLLKAVAKEISVPLAHTFNLSLSAGIFPERLKTSRVVPIHKGGDRACIDNYRPISLISSFSKILEKVVAVSLVNHLDFNNLLYSHQYGFQRNKSTEHNLLQATSYIYNALNNGEFCLGVFLDLRKAFDVCSHEILLLKLEKLGVKGKELAWFKSYLSNRTQVVDINGSVSSKKNINISVLQGSILGPILFLCYINDLYKCTNLFSLLFADDNATFKSGKNLNELFTLVNNELSKIAVWFRANKMALNACKTKFILFRTRNKKIPNPLPELIIDANEPGQPFDQTLVSKIDRVYDENPNVCDRSFKLLGIHLDEYLSFNYHTKHLCAKLSKSLFCISRAKNLLTLRALKMLYFSLVHSHLTYCPIILSGMSNKNKLQIFKMQKKAIRIISRAKFNEHTEPLFTNLNILQYDKIMLTSAASFMHSVVYKYAPKSFHNFWDTNEDRELQRDLRNVNLFRPPAPRIEIFKQAPIYQLPVLWNNLGDVKFQRNPIMFKCLIRNYFCSNETV